MSLRSDPGIQLWIWDGLKHSGLRGVTDTPPITPLPDTMSMPPLTVCGVIRNKKLVVVVTTAA